MWDCVKYITSLILCGKCLTLRIHPSIHPSIPKTDVTWWHCTSSSPRLTELLTLSLNAAPWPLQSKLISAACLWDLVLSVMTQRSWPLVRVGAWIDRLHHRLLLWWSWTPWNTSIWCRNSPPTWSEQITLLHFRNMALDLEVPRNVHRLELITANIIHLWFLATKEFTNNLSGLSLGNGCSILGNVLAPYNTSLRVIWAR